MEGKQVRKLLLNQRRGDGNLEIGESGADDDECSWICFVSGDDRNCRPGKIWGVKKRVRMTLSFWPEQL